MLPANFPAILIHHCAPCPTPGTAEAGLVHDGDMAKHPLDDGDGDTDMTVKHVELVDLTAPEEQETPEEPSALTEEQHEDDLALSAQHLREGGELDVAADDATLQLG
jgi:hypothetical protein